MIHEYHRPKTIEEALQLLNRNGEKAVPLAGGTMLNRHTQETIAVVDLQSLGLDFVEREEHTLRVGAMVRLQSLLEAAEIIDGLKEAIRLEAPVNFRQASTIAGTVVAGDGRSPLLAALLAMDTNLEMRYQESSVARADLGDWLPRRGNWSGGLITSIRLPLNVKFVYQYVARTPADLPIIGVAVAQWTSGRTRLVLCGWGPIPVLAMDGPESGGAAIAARNAASDASDEWASSEYRKAIAEVLTGRALKLLTTTRAGES